MGVISIDCALGYRNVQAGEASRTTHNRLTVPWLAGSRFGVGVNGNSNRPSAYRFAVVHGLGRREDAHDLVAAHPQFREQARKGVCGAGLHVVQEDDALV
jgi:hypothetical protein